MSAGPQLSESPAQPFGCWDLQLPKLCLPFPDSFSPFSPGRLKPDKKGQMQLPLDKSLQVRWSCSACTPEPPGPPAVLTLLCRSSVRWRGQHPGGCRGARLLWGEGTAPARSLLRLQASGGDTPSLDHGGLWKRSVGLIVFIFPLLLLYVLQKGAPESWVSLGGG